jgi:hypothetical protein
MSSSVSNTYVHPYELNIKYTKNIIYFHIFGSFDCPVFMAHKNFKKKKPKQNKTKACQLSHVNESI